VKPTPLIALDKQLRDGRHIVITLVPQAGTIWSYWMEARIDGEPFHERFTSPVRRNASNVPSLPHLIGLKPGIAVGLTDDEADGVEAAVREWSERPGRLAREAAPKAPTWILANRYVGEAKAGTVVDDDDGNPAMVLEITDARGTGDGPSFGFGAEFGVLYDLQVRALTAVERAELDGEQAHRDRVHSAHKAAAGAFGWTVLRYRGLPVPWDAEEVSSGAQSGPRVWLQHGWLTRTPDAFFSSCHDGPRYVNGTMRQPVTPVRVELFEILHAASDLGDLRRLGIPAP
jgi:hypothetical protein